MQGHMLASWVSQQAPIQLLLEGRMSAGSWVLQWVPFQALALGRMPASWVLQ